MANYYGDPVRPRMDVKINNVYIIVGYMTRAQAKSCMNTKTFCENVSLTIS
jgi:hypothetical protein